MFIDIIPLQKNTARLTRVYGDAPCAALPASVPGPEGGVLAITELGDYCFSEKPRSLPGADALCRYEVSPDGTCTLVQAFGRNLTGRHGRYDLASGKSLRPGGAAPGVRQFVEEITCGQPAGHRQLRLLQLPQAAAAQRGGRRSDRGQRRVPELFCAGRPPCPGRSRGT